MRNPTTAEHGIVDAVFAHRFVLRRRDGTRLLADLGPTGAKAYPLSEGEEVSIEGQAKPSEIKVATLTPKGGDPIVIAHGNPHERDDATDPARAIAEVTGAGLVPIGEPRRKPKHFEILARRGEDWVEVHVERGGGIRKVKPVEAGSEKWAEALDAKTASAA